MAVKVEDRTDVLHITGDSDFPLVELKKITIAERPQDGEEDKVLFYNPRHPDSFDDASMQSLLDAILEDGLLEPPIVRVFNPGKPDQIIQLVAGERRTRCLLKAYDENLMIYDKATNEKRPAREVISKIPCNVIYDCSDEKALRIAFTENTKHKGLSSREEIETAERLNRIYKKQDDICRILCTNPTWVSQTLSFREELPAEAFTKLVSGRMARYLAVELLSLKPEDRKKTYDAMVEEEAKERAIVLEKTKEELEQVDLEVEIHEADEELAEDEKAQEKATKAKERAIKKKKKVEEKLDKTQEAAGKLGQRHFEAATGKLNVTPRTPKMLGKAHIQQYFVNMVDQWIENGKKDPVYREVIPSEHLKLIKSTAEAILSGERDPSKIVREFMVAEGLWEEEEIKIAIDDIDDNEDDTYEDDDEDKVAIFNEDVEGHFQDNDDDDLGDDDE